MDTKDTKPKRPRGRPRRQTEQRMLDSLEHLTLFQRWQQEVLPRMQAAFKAGKGAEDLYKEFAGDAAARAIMIATTSPDAGKAMAAIVDILNRAQGKPTEQVQLSHKYEKLKDDELDALVLSVVNDKKGG